MSLVDNVKKQCRKKQIPVRKLEQEAQLPANSIYKWNEHVPAVDRVKRVADVLGIRIEELLKREEEP